MPDAPSTFRRTPAARPPSAASCRDVTHLYRTLSGPVQALTAINVDIRPGEVTAIVGPSGSGKSTLLRILASLDRATQGRVTVDGADLEALSPRRRRDLRRRRIGLVYARPTDNLLPYLTAAEHLVLAAQLRGVAPAHEPARLLDVLGLAARADHRPVRLSGGEQQRLAFAAAIIGAPALVLADEPTAELDRTSAERLVAAVRDLAHSRLALVRPPPHP